MTQLLSGLSITGVVFTLIFVMPAGPLIELRGGK